MATITLRCNSWILNWSATGKRFHQNLGRITEEQAKLALEDLRVGRLAIEKPRREQYTRTELGEIFRKSKQHAIKRGIPFLLTREEFHAMYAAAGGRCQLTGIAFDGTLASRGKSKRPWTVSIDRRDSLQPYTAANCRLVCASVNVALGEWGEVVLRRIALAITGYRGALV